MNLFFKKLKKIIPLEMYILLNKIRYLIIYRKYRNLNNEMLFTKIYKNKMWNNKSKLIFDSGSGSHEEFIVKKYVQTINNFLAKKKVSVVDLGCGDFNIASKFYKNCKKYYGIDVVPELISHLKKIQ